MPQLAHQTVLYMTNNGTRVVNDAFAREADQVITVSFVNFSATHEWLRKQTRPVLVIAAGERTYPDPHVYEDIACAETLQKALVGETVDFGQTVAQVKERVRLVYGPDYAKKPFPLSQALEIDLNLVTAIDTYNTVSLCTKLANGLIHVTSVSNSNLQV